MCNVLSKVQVTTQRNFEISMLRVLPHLRSQSRCAGLLLCEGQSYCCSGRHTERVRLTLPISAPSSLALHLRTLVCNPRCSAVQSSSPSKPCSSFVLVISSNMFRIPCSPCSRLWRTPQLFLGQPWRYRHFRAGDLRYHAVRAPRYLHDMHGTGGVHGVSAFDRGVAGHALHSPKREGKQARARLPAWRRLIQRTVSIRLRI